MKKIDFHGVKVYGTTKQVVNAICWATYRRGGGEWKGDNEKGATDVLAEYLWEHGANPAVYTPQRIKYVARMLKQMGYADLDQHPGGGKWYVRFAFHPDVDLRHEYQPEFVGKKDVAKVEQDTTFKSDITFDEESDLPPIPTVRPPRYLAEEINTVLDKWADKDPEVYGPWAEKVLQSIQAILDR